MSESTGESEQAIKDLEVPKSMLLNGQAQKCCVVVIGLLKSKPAKADTKKKKAENLKNEMKAIRKLGLTEDIVLPKTLHESAIKQISSCS